MATIAAAAIAAGSAYYANKQANKRSKADRDAQGTLIGNSKIAGEYGTDMLDRSRKALDPVYNYYSKLGTGDTGAVRDFLAPEISAINGQSRNAMQTGMELGARSGISTERNSRIPMDNASAIARLIAGARGQGIQGLAGLGTNWGNLGMAGLGQSTGGAQAVIGNEAARRAAGLQAGMDAGSSAYEIFKMIQQASAKTGSGTSAQQSFWNEGNQGPY